ncbi:MAG: hypothetical protein BIFFINMI_00737 [Phycisphaerae bacterium]|nr:hypothetical protein [Phycisphaerae bacterium]
MNRQLPGPGAQLALDTIGGQPTGGIATTGMNVMEHAHIERLAGAAPGDYAREPERVYLAAQRALGACLIDQWIPRNPLTMGDAGYEGKDKTATTGAETVVLDGVAIDSPEAVCAHLERVVWPGLRERIASFDADARVAEILAGERATQALFGPDLLKTGYGFVDFPKFRYGAYGYANYFMAYALYPEVIESDFALQARFALLRNRAAARACVEGGLPPLYRLDHDMADSRGTLVDIRSLDRIWFPPFAECIEPMLDAGVRLMWHCDGNLMAMVPRLIEAGVSGFQGFQYEDGMDYERICGLADREGRTLLVKAGVSVTTTLPHGRPADVRRQLDWLVEAGPRTGLFLGASSSIAPGVPWANIEALVDGLWHYRRRGRG